LAAVLWAAKSLACFKMTNKNFQSDPARILF
jgi:hypothetical protein